MGLNISAGSFYLSFVLGTIGMGVFMCGKKADSFWGMIIGALLMIGSYMFF